MGALRYKIKDKNIIKLKKFLKCQTKYITEAIGEKVKREDFGDVYYDHAATNKTI